MDVNSIIGQLTKEEKATLVAGTDFMYTNSIPRLGIGSVRLSDGPHGLRVQQKNGDNGTSCSDPATCFPTAVTTASSWNPENTYLMGRAMGKEAKSFGIHVILGPAVNIKRNPLGGRCFEYFSEDPYLAGKMGTAEVLGIQSEGVGVSLKHFALNNSENYRFMGDSVADMRAIREIYLKPFEMIVKGAKPETVMCAYNKINGVYCSENKWLLTDVLRDEWGFSGLVMTDWGATHDRLAMLKAGLDLEMPGDTAICKKWILDGLASGELDEAILDNAVRNVLTLIAKHENDKREDADFHMHHLLAKQIAKDGAVLMKNDGTLPLCMDGEFLAVGELFEKPRYQGAGSSMINPMFISTPKSAFDASGVKYTYARGYRENETEVDGTLISEALIAAEKYDSIIAFIGLTDYVESEGFDREHMRLPDNQLALIDALIKTGKTVSVVLYGGSAYELPFADKVNAILNMHLPGQNGGEAMRELLFGEANPSGKLAESWPMSYSDVPFGENFSKERIEVYKESIFVGYRYYLTRGKKVRYPFGYGLSYTTFEYENMTVEKTADGYRISCDVINTKDIDGAEVVQLYVGKRESVVYRPVRELRGFAKLYLKGKERGTAQFTVKNEDLAFFDVKKNRFVTESGEYIFDICSDCQTVKLSSSVAVDAKNVVSPYSDDVNEIYSSAELESVKDEVFEKILGKEIPQLPPKLPITVESRFSDMKSTFMGRILYNSVLLVAKIDLKKAKRLPEGVERDNKIKGALMLRNILSSNSLISMSMCSGGHFSYNMAKGFADMANGKIISGIRKMCVGEKTSARQKNKENG